MLGQNEGITGERCLMSRQLLTRKMAGPHQRRVPPNFLPVDVAQDGRKLCKTFLLSAVSDEQDEH
jgi:hypothetical protein